MFFSAVLVKRTGYSRHHRCVLSHFCTGRKWAEQRFTGIACQPGRREPPRRDREIICTRIMDCLIFCSGRHPAYLSSWPDVLSASIRSDIVYDEAMGFLKIRVWGIPFLYLFQMCNALLVGTNNSRYMKYGFWIQALLNILLDYAFDLWALGSARTGL